MSKIKLLILLLISINLTNCTNNNIYQDNKYSVGYIGSSMEGLLLKNKLESNLRAFNLYSQQTNYLIEGNIGNSFSIYVPTTNKTSQRENVTTGINLKIFNKNLNCYVYSFEDTTSQFYIYASSTYFLSNKEAQKDIINDNINNLIIDFINSLPSNLDNCAE